MGVVRPLREEDLGCVVRLYERVLGKMNSSVRDRLKVRLSRILIGHPWQEFKLPSYVFEDDGHVVGCLGVLPRPMSMNGRDIMAAVSHSFIVEPGARSSLAALQLMRHFMTGPQELALAEGNETSRRIWEGVGGSTSLVYSLYWTRPLRLGHYVLSVLKRRGLSAGMAAILRPGCSLLDIISRHIAQGAFQLPEPRAEGIEMDPEMMLASLAALPRTRRLRPSYSVDALSWILETLSEKPGRGRIRKILVKDAGKVLGWYLYCLSPGPIAEVIQIAGDEETMGTVLDHLFFQATQDGAIAVAGQLDPVLFKVLGTKSCVFHHDGSSWMLLHARNQEVIDAIQNGRAFLTRMEAEWWISSFLA
jgi:hypothetical protein